MGTSQSVEERIFNAVGSDDVSALDQISADVEKMRHKPDRHQRHPVLDWRSYVNCIHPKTGFTPLLHGASLGSVKAMRWLVAHGANVNAQVPSNSDSVLHIILKANNPRARKHGPHMLALMLNSAVSPRTTNGQGVLAVDLARRISKGVVNAAQNLRTLEVNNSYMHGTVHVEEHGDLARFTGSVLNMFGDVRNGSRARDTLTSTFGGVYKPRWFALLSQRVVEQPVLVVYQSFADMQPMFSLPAATLNFSPSKTVRNPLPINGALGDLAGSSKLTRFRLESPDLCMNLELPEAQYTRWVNALAIAQQVTQELAGRPISAANSHGSMQPPVAEAVPVDQPAGAPIAEAVVLGPADAPEALPSSGAAAEEDADPELREALNRSLQDASALKSASYGPPQRPPAAPQQHLPSAPPSEASGAAAFSAPSSTRQPPVILPAVPEALSSASSVTLPQPSAPPSEEVDDEIQRLEAQLAALKKAKEAGGPS